MHYSNVERERIFGRKKRLSAFVSFFMNTQCYSLNIFYIFALSLSLFFFFFFHNHASIVRCLSSCTHFGRLLSTLYSQIYLHSAPSAPPIWMVPKFLTLIAISLWGRA